MTNEAIIEVSSDNFEEKVLKADKPVLVDFWAEWCGPCRMVAPVLDELAEENKAVTIAKLNVDENQELAFKFGVQSIPSFILFRDGEVVGRKMGAMPKAAFEQFLGEHVADSGAPVA